MRLMPDAPLPMHVENLVLYALVVIAAFAFYRRFLGATWVAGLAASLYALDPGHAQSEGLIAGRNTLLAPLFGMLALISHDRARRDGDRRAGMLGVALLALSMLSGESGLSTLLYLLAYALFFDPAPTPSLRLRALAPHLALACAYVGAYRHFGFGARASGMYCDPAHDTGIYLRALPVRAPIYLLGLLGLPPASIFAALSRPAAVGLALFGAAFLVVLALLLRPLLRRDPIARFFACGALLGVLPIASIIPNDRVLFFAGLGAFGLVAQLALAAFAEARRAPRVMTWALLVIHLPLALLLFPASAYSMNLLARSSREPLDAILLEPEAREQTAILVNPPSQFMVSHLAAMRLGKIGRAHV
jgi:hypothetical protein